MKKYLIGVTLILAAAALALEPPALVLIHARGRDDVNLLMREGIEVDTCVAPTPEGVVAFVTAADREFLGRLGFGYDVLFADARDAVAWTSDWDGPRYGGSDAIPYDHYLNYAEFTAAMQELATTYPAITSLVLLGKTVGNRDIWALKISKDAQTEGIEPELRLVGAHHGNEKIGYMVALYAAEEFCAGYGVDPDVTALIDGAEIWCVPMMNADGVEANTRNNLNGVDLNRNYSYAWQPGPGYGSAPFSEPETRAIRDLSQDNVFVMSHSYHSGAKYVNYVWNYQAPMPNDLNVILYLSNIYSSHSTYPIINGYAWYETHGDLNDWSYGERGDPDDTIEVYSPGYNPPASGILAVCQQNWPAIVNTFKPAMIEVVKGTVKDADTLQPLAATVTPLEIDWPAYTDASRGDYYKMLRPGTYTLKASAEGYASATEAGVVVNANQPTVVNFLLHKTGSPVTIEYFHAASRADGVTLSWKATGEAAAGYNLYREGTAAKTRARVNASPVTGRSPFRFLDEETPAGRWRYFLTALDMRGREETVASVTVVHGGVKPATFELGAAYPNPARGELHIPFGVAEAGRARVTVYDLAGRRVAVLYDAETAPGGYDVAVNASALAPGVYIYRLEAGGNVAARRMVVTR